MKIAAIDIGTNTVLLLVAQINRAGGIAPLVYEQRVPRLGKGVDAGKNLQPESMRRDMDVLAEYKRIMSQHKLDAVVLAGTSAVRDAENKAEFVQALRYPFILYGEGVFLLRLVVLLAKYGNETAKNFQVSGFLVVESFEKF